MIITNEIILKVFAQYLGSCKIIDPINYTELLSVYVLKHENLPHFKLILKPLSEITDEDAIELAKISGFDYRIESKESELSGALFSGFNHIPMAYQYLISKGYDLPQYLLGGKTLKESGLAVYE